MGTIAVRSSRAMAVPLGALTEAILDLGTWGDWFDLHGGWPDGVPPLPQTGKWFRQRVVIHGVGDNVTWTVRSAHLPKELVLQGEGTYGSSVELRFAVEPAESPTMTCELQIDGPWFAPAPLKRVAVRTLEAEIDRVLVKLELHVRANHLGEPLAPDELLALAHSPAPPKLFSAAQKLLGIRDS